MNNEDKKYEQIYQRCIKICPDMKTIIEKLRQIPSPRKREREMLISKIKSGDNSAKSRLVEMYLRNAMHIALEAAEVSSLPLEDVFSETVIGLMERLNCPTENKNYSSFLKLGMCQAAFNYIKKNEEEFLSHEEYCEIIKGKYYDGEKLMMRHIYLNHLNKILNKALDNLTCREKSILNLRFGLENSDKYSHQKIAEFFGIDKNRIRFIERKALRKLRLSNNYSDKLRKLL